MTSQTSPIEITDRLTDADGRSLAYDVHDGLSRLPKELPPKHAYDHAGALLFDRICEQPEYYPTRAERAILRERAGEIVARTGAAELLELGSGVPAKTRVLLDAMRDAGTLTRYLPFDVAEGVLRESAEELVAEYPGLRVHGVLGDFERHLGAVPAAEGPRIVALLGGTIGNFLPGSRRRFLRQLGAMLGPGDHLLLGTDLVKDPAVIEAAYDDAAGVSAAFNRNVLAVVNRELGADFDLDAFEHVAVFDREREWMDIRLRARGEQVVTIPALGLVARFADGEELRTEISAKFTDERLRADLAAAGLRCEAVFTDDERRFALSLSAPAATAED
jgi:L-histidine N-alpha-methyltransferase